MEESISSSRNLEDVDSSVMDNSEGSLATGEQVTDRVDCTKDRQPEDVAHLLLTDEQRKWHLEVELARGFRILCLSSDQV